MRRTTLPHALSAARIAVVPLLAAAIAFVLVATPCRPAAAAARTTGHAPSRSQLARLLEYDPLIRHFASLSYGKRGARVPSNYVRALVLGESSARHHATSHKGARGLTQIMPETAKDAVAALLDMRADFLYVNRDRLESFTAQDLYDPAVNLLIASYLTATYHADYNGSAALVTAAWNAGPHAVKRHGNATPPYAETHQLINRVNAYMQYFETGSFTAHAGERWNTGSWNSPGWNRAFDSSF